MIKEFESVRELLDAARAAGHDSLGIWNDIEALMELANVSRRRFLEGGGTGALRTWRDAVLRVEELESADENVLAWKNRKLIELETCREQLESAKAMLDADLKLLKSIKGVRSRIPKNQFEEVAKPIELSCICHLARKEAEAT